jgi:hypothetical protein
MTTTRALLTRGLAGLAVAGLAVLGLPGVSHAFSGEPVTLTAGPVACDPATGEQVVVWTLENPSGSSLTIDSATVDAGGLSSGDTVSVTATMSPSTVANGGTSTGETRATGDATGDYHLVIAYTFADQDPTIDGEVVLPGGCVQAAVTTTTTAVTTTTAPAARAAAVAAAPAFTG